MAKLLLITAVPLVLLLNLGLDDVPQADLEAIKQTALDYGEGWYLGDGDRMQRALHPELAKRALIPVPRSRQVRLDHIGALSLINATRAGYGKDTPIDKRRTEVTIFDVTANAASVKLMMYDWVDYMHMRKIDGQWKIINVLWEFTPEAKQRMGMPTDT